MPLALPVPHVVRVAVDSPAQGRRLQRLHLDTGDTVVDGTVAVVLRGTRDGRRLRVAGFKRVKAPAPPAHAAAGALPSGRTTYRTLDDYERDMDALAAAHPGLVRKLTLPGTSVQGRPIHGLEIATGVDRTDDGRPTVLEVGLHHAREWSSGEMVMEHAFDLAQHAADDARIARLVAGVRTVVVPVMNPDGLVLSQATVGGDPYKRKNCAGGVAGSCGDGVDLNRNYGAFWGGPGASALSTDGTFRGAAPFSEPEVRALRDLTVTRQIAVVNMTHNFGGQVLYQPGFDEPDEPGLPARSALPYAKRMAAVGAAMAQAAGYTAGPAYTLYDATGAAEDLTYYAQGALGYTTEIAGADYHGPFAGDVIGGWPGMRELFLRAGEAALDARNHATITGTAPPGATLTLAKDVALSTSYVDGGAAQPFTEHVGSTLTVPASGRYRWSVNPSTPPLVRLAGRTQPWTLSCPGETRHVTVGMGRTATVDLGCGTTTLRIGTVRRSGKRLVVRLRIGGGPLKRLRVTVGGRVVTRATAPARLTLRAPDPGGHRLKVTGTAPDGRRLSASRWIRVRPAR